ncbi:MAG: 3-oxoacyl-ACP reductase family protein [bacterium]|nr:3-oxoacyl-ACP reductase family protein [bacterium]
MFDLSGKVALVTGASSGIGRASAIALAVQGAKVVVAARRFDRLQALAAEIKSRGSDALPLALDITNLEQIQKTVDETVHTFGRLDILVNNAGVVESGPLNEATEARWDKVLDVNLKGYFFMAQAAVRQMRKNPTTGGRIVNIASIASGGVGIGFSQVAEYCASKGGVVGLTEALAAELGPEGILVNCIGPGFIETEMTADMVNNPDMLKNYLPRIPINRAGKPEEIAAAVVFLASDEASYTTGATLYVDGGWLAG